MNARKEIQGSPSTVCTPSASTVQQKVSKLPSSANALVDKPMHFFAVVLSLFLLLGVGTTLQYARGAAASEDAALVQDADEGQSTNNGGETYVYYFPIIHKSALGAKFSIGGVANESAVLQVVPQGVQADPYVWDVLPLHGSSIQIIRACTYYRPKTYVADPYHQLVHYDWYFSYKVGHLCWDPITSRVAKIVSDPACPYGQAKPCLDTEIKSHPAQGETTFRQLVRDNPEWTWIIGNEPDLTVQDAFADKLYISDGYSVRTVELGGTWAYAHFFKQIYDIVAHESSAAPKLVFCQATFAHDKHANMGLNFCRQAFDHLKGMGLGAANVYALSVHQYSHDSETFNGVTYGGGPLLDGVTRPYGDHRSVLDLAVAKWIEYLQQFESWAKSEGMGETPLWLTEYGSLVAWCYEAQDEVNMEPGGVACPEADNGRQLYPFYGRNSNEGIWGLQQRQMAYLARHDNQWKAGWWFVSTMGWGTGSCFQTGWLWNADFDCEAGSHRPNNLSRAGQTHLQVLDCLTHGGDCVGRALVRHAADSATERVPTPQPQCKPFEDMLCQEFFGE